MSNLYDLIGDVIKWGKDRNMFTDSDIKTQMLKCVSEIGELADNVAKGRDITDDVGDAMVTLILVSHFRGLTIEECLEYAFNEIKDRKGRFENGTFVKESDRA